MKIVPYMPQNWNKTSVTFHLYWLVQYHIPVSDNRFWPFLSVLFICLLYSGLQSNQDFNNIHSQFSICYLLILFGKRQTSDPVHSPMYCDFFFFFCSFLFCFLFFMGDQRFWDGSLSPHWMNLSFLVQVLTQNFVEIDGILKKYLGTNLMGGEGEEALVQSLVQVAVCVRWEGIDWLIDF